MPANEGHTRPQMIVPTLCVVTGPATLCVASGQLAAGWMILERHRLRSHAERGNDPRQLLPQNLLQTLNRWLVAFKHPANLLQSAGLGGQLE
mgnify:FL=1